MEKQYLELNKNIASLTPQKQSKGRSFVNTIGKDVLSPVAKNIGKQYLEKILKKKLGIDGKDALGLLKDEVDKLKLKKELKELQDPNNISFKDKSEFVKNWNTHKRYKQAVSEYEKEYGEQQVDDFVDTTATDAGKDYVSKVLAVIGK